MVHGELRFAIIDEGGVHDGKLGSMIIQMKNGSSTDTFVTLSYTIIFSRHILIIILSYYHTIF